MPWELDDTFQILTKIATIKRNLNPDDNVCIDTCLNLSSYIIDWSSSKIPKDFFIEKYNYIHKILYEFEYKTKVYDGSELYGHLDFQREIVSTDTDYYIAISPDIYFHPHTIFYLIESAKQIKNKYFMITPEIPKLWDQTWDMMVNKNLNHYKYEEWENRNINEIIHISQNISEDSYIEKLPSFKWAGWLDIYNKEFYEKLIPCFSEWHGYGPYDLFGITVCTIAKQQFKVDVEQYILRNQIIFDKDIGIYQNKKNLNPYKKYISLHNIPNQRKIFESKLNEYINKWMIYAKTNKII